MTRLSCTVLLSAAIACAPSAGDAPPAQFDATLVSHFSGGAASRDTLVLRFLDAVATHDTAALRNLVLTQAEVAAFYYPTAREALPPYDLPPDLFWFRLAGQSEQGIRKALRVLGGKSHGFQDYACAPDLDRAEGRNTLWGGCVTRRVVQDDTLHERLFGLIIERDGVYKFVSYANGL